MSKMDLNTEQAILEAAKQVFIQKGMDGARMQEIADKAGINKSLLHYYYRSKNKLFEAVFKEAFFKFIPNIMDLMNSELPLFEKIRLFAINYIDIINENPLMPVFIMHELNRDPAKVAEMIKSTGINPSKIIIQINEEIAKGEINPIDPFHLIVNLISMCIFPFVAQPILQYVIFNENSEVYAAFIEQRKREVPEFIINSIKKDKRS